MATITEIFDAPPTAPNVPTLWFLHGQSSLWRVGGGTRCWLERGDDLHVVWIETGHTGEPDECLSADDLMAGLIPSLAGGLPAPLGEPGGPDGRGPMQPDRTGDGTGHGIPFGPGGHDAPIISCCVEIPPLGSPPDGPGPSAVPLPAAGVLMILGIAALALIQMMKRAAGCDAPGRV